MRKVTWLMLEAPKMALYHFSPIRISLRPAIPA